MIDQDRMEGGKALANELRGSRRGGIPWHVILDANGKEVIDSTGPKGNVGCPAQPHEIDYFCKMIDETRKHMSDVDRKVIERELRIYGKQLTTRRNRTPGYAEYAKAIKSVKFGRFDDAVAELGAACAKGFPPARFLSDKNLWALREDPDQRPKLVALGRKHTRTSRVSLVEPNEKGRPIRLYGRVVDMDSGDALPGATIQFMQTDASGEYRPGMDAGQGAGNPRLWGFARTDAEGRFVLDTVMPERYANASVPRHIHYNVWVEGRALMRSECFFDDDPLLSEATRKSAPKRNFPIVKLALDEEARRSGKLVIHLPKK